MICRDLRKRNLKFHLHRKNDSRKLTSSTITTYRVNAFFTKLNFVLWIVTGWSSCDDEEKSPLFELKMTSSALFSWHLKFCFEGRNSLWDDGLWYLRDWISSAAWHSREFPPFTDAVAVVAAVAFDLEQCGKISSSSEPSSSNTP